MATWITRPEVDDAELENRVGPYLIMRPNHARMSDKLLEELVFLKCNDFNEM